MLNMKLVQSGVNPAFRMLVPVYLELANGQVTRLGTAQTVGNATVEQKVTLAGVKDKPKHAMIKYHNDVLATMN